MFPAGVPVQQQERGPFTRPFVFGLILLLLFLTATSEIGPPPARSNASLTLKGDVAEQEDPLKDEIVYKLSVANAQLEKENRIMRMHILEMRRLIRDCKGANFTTDLQRAYRLSDLKSLRAAGGRQHHRRGGSAAQQQQQHPQQQQQAVVQQAGAQQHAGVTEQAAEHLPDAQQQGQAADAGADVAAGVNARLLAAGSPFERH